LFNVKNGLLTSIWFKLFESTIVLLIMYLIFVNITKDNYILSCILIPTFFLTLYVEYTFKTPWPRILLPFSLGNSTLLASIMFRGVFNNPYVYKWIIVCYAIALFTLFHALSRMFSIFLSERKSRFRAILDGVLIDTIVFIIVSSLLASILIYYRAIILLYGIMLVIGEILVLILIPWITRRYIIYGLFERRVAVMGYSHPRDIQIENFYFELSSIAVIFILIVPALIAYTSTTLEKRAFIPLALLSVYELLTMSFYALTYLTGIHGSFIESLVGDRLAGIEYGCVVTKWRDIAWFINNSLIYYLRMKYLSALYMLFQGLELLSFRVGNKKLYYGSIAELMSEGFNIVMKNNLLSKYVLVKFLVDAIELFKENNIYVIEPKVHGLINNSALEDNLKKCLGGIVNIYCKFNELGEISISEIKRSIAIAIRRLENLMSKVDDENKEYVKNYIDKLSELLNKEKYSVEDFEEFVEKRVLTINMFRNYLVHGQLFKNAIVYKGSRVAADRFLNKPSVLYAVYTLLITIILTKYPELHIQK